MEKILDIIKFSIEEENDIALVCSNETVDEILDMLDDEDIYFDNENVEEFLLYREYADKFVVDVYYYKNKSHMQVSRLMDDEGEINYFETNDLYVIGCEYDYLLEELEESSDFEVMYTLCDCEDCNEEESSDHECECGTCKCDCDEDCTCDMCEERYEKLTNLVLKYMPILRNSQSDKELITDIIEMLNEHIGIINGK